MCPHKDDLVLSVFIRSKDVSHPLPWPQRLKIETASSVAVLGNAKSFDADCGKQTKLFSKMLSQIEQSSLSFII